MTEKEHGSVAMGDNRQQSRSRLMRETIANIVDPHSFLPDNSGDDLIAEMVRQGKQDALRKADRVIAAMSATSPGLPEEPKRRPLDRAAMKFGTCHQCGSRDNLGRTDDDTLICGSCSDANYLAEWIDYARALRHAAPQPAHGTSATERVVDEGPADQIVGQIEAIFPDWRSYRDLVDCIECTLHRLKSEGSTSGR